MTWNEAAETYFKMLSQHSFGESEENYKIIFQCDCVMVDIRTCYRLNTKYGCYALHGDIQHDDGSGGVGGGGCDDDDDDDE